MTWSDLQRLNNQGLLVLSREVFQNPPPDAELDPQIARIVVPAQHQLDLVLLLAAVGLFIETMLLAGPAFAVSAARQRRSLALAATNGADARQVRRYVLGQAVVLGVLSAAVAVVASVPLTLAGLTWWKAGGAVALVLGCRMMISALLGLIGWFGTRLMLPLRLAARDAGRRRGRSTPAVAAIMAAVAALTAVSSVPPATPRSRRTTTRPPAPWAPEP